MNIISTTTTPNYTLKTHQTKKPQSVHIVKHGVKLEISSQAHLLYEHYLQSNPPKLAKLSLNDITLMQKVQQEGFRDNPYGKYLLEHQISLMFY